MLLYFTQLCGGICAAIDRWFACHSKKQSRAQAVNITANVFRLVRQSLRRDVKRRSPNDAIVWGTLRTLCCEGSKPEVANLCGLFIDKQMLADFTSR